MSRKVFTTILQRVSYDDYFRLKKDATGKHGFTSYHKCTTTARMLAYGVASNLVYEYMRMTESTFLASIYTFCKVVVQVFAK
jgi:hypothetical protein